MGLGPPLLLGPALLLDPLSPGRRKGTIGFCATCTGRSVGACAIRTAGTAKGGRLSNDTGCARTGVSAVLAVGPAAIRLSYSAITSASVVRPSGRSEETPALPPPATVLRTAT